MFHIEGIPGRQNDFFRKIVHAKSFTGFTSEYFFSKFQKEVLEHFRRHLSYYWGNPQATKLFFSKKSFTPKASKVLFLNIFFKIPKGGVRRLQAASNGTIGGIEILIPSIF